MFEIVGGVDIPQGDTGRDRDWEGTVGKEAPILKMRENSEFAVSQKPEGLHLKERRVDGTQNTCGWRLRESQ